MTTNSPICRKRWPLALALAALMAAPVGVQAAPKRPAVEVENLRVGFAAGDRNNLFKVGAWVPVWVQLRAGAERFSGLMEVVVPDDDGTPTSSRQVVDLGPGESRRFTAYVRAGTMDPDFEIRLFNANGRLQGRALGSSLATIAGLRPSETLLMTLGKPQGVEQIPTLPGFSDKATPGNEIAVARLDAAGGLLPGRWYGYDSARAVVLDTNDADVMEALGALRGQALIDWVRRGGHLVVAVGSSWQRARDSVIGPILPAVLAGNERLTDLGALESFCGSTKQIVPPGTPVQVVKLTEVEARGGKVLAATGAVPLVVRGAYGFGRVTVVALDVDQRPFASWADRALFWVRAIDLRNESAESSDTLTKVGGGTGPVYQSGIRDLSSQLRQALEQFPGVDLVPFGWVAFFIFIYILLIGPGDYFFVKHVLKRMELTWITFPLIVVTVSVLAYVAAYAIKGHELRVNKVDIVDIDQPSGLARGSTFLDIFSPQNRDYDVAIVPAPVDRAATGGENDDTFPPKTPAGTEVLLSWFGVPEAGFGGMGGSGRLSFGSGGYAYQPTGGAEMLTGVRVPIWSTKCLAGRWFGSAPATVDADLRPVGTDRLAGTVTNRLDTPLVDAVLAFNLQVYLLGTIAPGQTIQVELASDRHLSGLLKGNRPKYLSDQPYASNDFRISRPDLLLALMFHDSATSAGAEATLASSPLHGLDLTGQLALDRPMLVARVDRPGTRLVLGNASSTPRIDQTTMLRVILPLKP